MSKRESLEYDIQRLMYDGFSVKFFYDRDFDSRKPFGTNCRIYNRKTNTAYFGISRCHKNDEFRKTMGKMIALNRACYAMETKALDERFKNTQFFKWYSLNNFYSD